ncbi:TetR/AcrR family transcriptional regulator [Actinotalea sp. BY-33]|uniref:TetR/AcrR family transcriptional regulator n=1 Tax=Actinotalea soli TaxID=2819234 RepID=A0A939LU51_9CELL|nr:TetR/AcrR family transcriptional regulator [Actinotalea soli]MBO1752715.1 TetR/AcrR family transcriptional regulator [Actinotalea soli]
MPAIHPITDRRAALKERHRRAIVAAAAVLLEETGGLNFTIEDLAVRADVSRRTVFNHFASLGDVLAAVFDDVMAELVDCYTAQPPPEDAAQRSASVDEAFDELAAAVRATDLVPSMSYLTRSLGDKDQSPWVDGVLLRVLEDGGLRLAAAMRERRPGVDALEIDLLVNTVLHGVLVVHRHWYEATAAADDDASRAVWSSLVDRFLARLRSGYAREHDPGDPTSA